MRTVACVDAQSVIIKEERSPGPDSVCVSVCLRVSLCVWVYTHRVRVFEEPCSGHVIRMLKKDNLDPVFFPVQNPDGSSRWLANPHPFAIWNCTVWTFYCPKKSELSRSFGFFGQFVRSSRDRQSSDFFVQ
jgi:hypothetical protein